MTNNFTFTFHFHALEKEMATHSNVLEPGESQGWGSLVGCRLWGRTESDTTDATKQQQQQQRPAFLFVCMLSCSVLSDSLQPHGL